ncbi:Transglutaminase [Bordetella sputigena]|uniref:transglutaminase-like cysteine peptidase n=1 Tax=Bordetella sputigena TaxID=1416810 RepID=UPI0039F00110
MAKSHPSRAVLALVRAAFFCLLFGWGISGALELDTARLEQVAASRYGSKGAHAVAAWLQLLQADTALPEADKLTSINNFWNRSLLQAEDQTIWHQADYWATPLESLGKGAGDCEDFVIGKYFSLIKLGVPTGKLRFVYVRARIGGPESSEQIAHMVLAYYPTPNSVPLVLDSLISDILPASQRRDLVPVFSFNADGVYVDGKHAAPVDRIGRWRDLLQRMAREGIRQ